MKKYIFLLIILYSFGVHVLAQNYEANISLNGTLTGDQSYTATEQITLQPGFQYAATSNGSFYGNINSLLVTSPEGAKYKTVPNGDGTSENYVVGELAGGLLVTGSGAAQYSVPIECPAGINGLQPNLAIVYNSQAGMGLVGYKANLAGLSSISRVKHSLYYDNDLHPVSFDGNDRFALDGKRLVGLDNNYGAPESKYGFEMEDFTRVVAKGSYGDGPKWFEVTQKNGTTLIYGVPDTVTSNANMILSDALGVYEWYLYKVIDRNGNYMEYVYDNDPTDGETWISEIKYGGNSSKPTGPMYSVNFEYTDYMHNQPKFIAGNKLTASKLLESINVLYHDDMVNNYSIEYGRFTFEYYLQISKIILKNSVGEKLYPIEFTWSNFFGSTESLPTPPDGEKIFTGNFTSNGKQQLGVVDNDILKIYELASNVWTCIYTFDEAASLGWTGDLNVEVGDYNGDGCDDICFSRTFNDQDFEVSPYSSTVLSNVFVLDVRNDIYDYWSELTSLGAYEGFRDFFIDGDFNGDNNNSLLYLNDATSGKLYNFTFNDKHEINYDSNVDYWANYVKDILSADLDGDGRDEVIFHYDDKLIVFNLNGTTLNEQYTINGTYKKVHFTDFNDDGLPDILDIDPESGQLFYGTGIEGDFSFASNSTQYGVSLTDLVSVNWINSIISDGWQGNIYGSVNKFSFIPVDFNADNKIDIGMMNTSEITYTLSLRAYIINLNQPIPDMDIASQGFIPKSWLDLLSDYIESFNDDLKGITNFSGYSLTRNPKNVFSNNGILTKEDGTPLRSDTDDIIYTMKIATPLGLTMYRQGYEGKIRYRGTILIDDEVSQNISDLLVGDYKGDGRIDLFGIDEINSTVHLLTTNHQENNYNIGSIKTLGSKTTNIEQKRLNVGTYYSRDYNNNDKIISVAGGLMVTSQITQPNGVKTDYTYSNALYHKEQQRFLGFQQTTQSSYKEVSGVTHYLSKTVSDNQLLNNTYLLPYWKEQYFNNHLLNTSIVNYSLKSEQIDGVNRSYIILDRQGNTNALTGVYTQKEFTQYSSGNAGNIKQTFYKNGAEIPNAFVENQVTFTSAGALFPYLKHTIKTLKNNGGEEAYERNVEYSYDANTGNVNQVIYDKDDATFQVIQNYTNYDAFGNPCNISTVNNGSVRSVTYTYSDDGRFVKKETDDQSSFYTAYTYDESRGLLIRSTNHLGLRSENVYDGFGRLTRSISPDGNNTSISYQWAGSDAPAGAVYGVYTIGSGVAPVTNWFNNLGQEIYTETYSYDETKPLIVEKEYDDLGRLVKTYGPYFEGEVRASYFDQHYDDYGRIDQINDQSGSHIYTFDGLSTTLTETGNVTTNVLNALGEQVSSTVNDKTVHFTYWPSGNIHTSTPEDGQRVTTYFDLVGNRTKIEDPNAGESNFSFNGWGELVWEEYKTSDATGAEQTIRTDYNYDLIGRVTSQTRDGEVTEYTYDDNTGLTLSIENPNHKVEYSYDEGSSKPLGRLSSKKETIDGEVFTDSYAYDAYGREVSHIFPSGYVTYNTYTTYGQLSEITDDSRSIWKMDEVNARGMLLSETKGNYTTTFGYNTPNGNDVLYLTSISTPGIMNLGYSYNNDGNLVNRSQPVFGTTSVLTESFTYTDNQLKTYNVPYTENVTYNIDYDAIGNITAKTDINGTFMYDQNRKQTIAAVYGDHTLPEETQTITYASNRKVATIIEGNATYSLSYGIHNQRVKSVLNESGTQTTRYYLGNYEETQKGSTNEKIHYIFGGSGLAGVYKETNSVGNFYYAYCDNQGSLMALTNEAGTIVERYAYDPWGRRRNPENPDEYDSRTNLIVNRGFTLHEHLDAFNLIDMNGRVYDPTIARFLSPDPFIQAPGNWLSFNRYAYCMNNPLKYTDPSGYKWFDWWKWPSWENVHNTPIIGQLAYLMDVINANTTGLREDMENAGVPDFNAGYNTARGSFYSIGNNAPVYPNEVKATTDAAILGRTTIAYSNFEQTESIYTFARNLGVSSDRVLFNNSHKKSNGHFYIGVEAEYSYGLQLGAFTKLYGGAEIDLLTQTLWEGKFSNVERYSRSYELVNINSAEKVKVASVKGGWSGLTGSVTWNNNYGENSFVVSLSLLGFGGNINFDQTGVLGGFVGVDLNTGISFGHGVSGTFKLGYEWQ